MRFNSMEATERQSDEATKGSDKGAIPSSPPSLRRFVASSLFRRRVAFTLIEIMIVVVIIGLLAGLVTYSTVGYIERANRHKARADLSTLAGAVQSFYADKHRYPDNPEGLQVLVTEKYIPSLPKDPWGHPYQYFFPGKNGADSFDIISFGKDGREGGTGADADISSNDVEVREVGKK